MPQQSLCQGAQPAAAVTETCQRTARSAAAPRAVAQARDALCLWGPAARVRVSLFLVYQGNGAAIGLGIFKKSIF